MLDGLIEIKINKHKILMLIYILLTFFSILGVILTYGSAFPVLVENPPRKTFTIGGGNVLNATIHETKLTIDIPRQIIDIQVTFNMSKSDTCFLYALLPFTASTVAPYALYYNRMYPLSIYYPDHPENLVEIGSCKSHLLNTPEGLAVLNASFQPNERFFGYTKITVGASVSINETLLAIDDSNSGKKTVIYTFFGGNTNWTEEMSAFMTPMCQEIVITRTPFIVNIALPDSYYYSSSQPSPIEYFVNNNSRWIMFSMDFLEGKYAQTLVCNFENPTNQSNRQFNVFMIGVFVTLAATFALEAVREGMSSEVRIIQDKEKPLATINRLKVLKRAMGEVGKSFGKKSLWRKSKALRNTLSLMLAFGIFISVTTFWIMSPWGLRLQIDTTSIAENNTLIIGQPPNYNSSIVFLDGKIVMAKIPIVNIPTVINGITASTSIVVGLSGAVIGIMIRELFQDNRKARYFLISILFYFIFVFAYQFSIYALLVSGALDMALRWSISGLLLSLLIFVASVLVPPLIIEMEKEACWVTMDY